MMQEFATLAVMLARKEMEISGLRAEVARLKAEAESHECEPCEREHSDG